MKMCDFEKKKSKQSYWCFVNRWLWFFLKFTQTIVLRGIGDVIKFMNIATPSRKNFNSCTNDIMHFFYTCRLRCMYFTKTLHKLIKWCITLFLYSTLQVRICSLQVQHAILIERRKARFILWFRRTLKKELFHKGWYQCLVFTVQLVTFGSYLLHYKCFWHWHLLIFHLLISYIPCNFTYKITD